jgi:hypothetical protein
MIRLKPLDGFFLSEAERMLGFDVEDDHGGGAYLCPHGQPIDLCWKCECWANSLRQIGRAIESACQWEVTMVSFAEGLMDKVCQEHLACHAAWAAPFWWNDEAPDTHGVKDASEFGFLQPYDMIERADNEG